ncbi:hypothetical protein BD289DRAFT_473276 [Coniella lustricola]|uniref:Uncharacterized protein n=1 Tax=Coniella lustricola TaxID=2025994 RepID=A0A2T3AC74_9PEZI|nr:hypothetical protein BD289DRAFT_473276 [Coniella lustricola]
MFEVPNSKRVRREELYASSSDDGSHDGNRQQTAKDDAEDLDVRAKLNERLSQLLGLDLSSTTEPAAAEQHQPPAVAAAAAAAAAAETPATDNEQQPQDGAGEEHEDKHEEEFEFRLFSTSAKTTAPAKVILTASDDEDADMGDGAFTVPARPRAYYLLGEPTVEELERYRCAAVAGEDIVLGARKRAWGMERPWRVVRITASGEAIKGDNAEAKPGSTRRPKTGADNEEKGQQEKRKRPGKKRRIAMRVRTKAEQVKKENEDKQKMSKEEHLAEKKKRLNRERKLKRRAKEREKKATGGDENGAQQGPGAAADSGSE